MKRLKQMIVLILVLVVFGGFTPRGFAGDLAPSTDPAPSMHSLEDIYTLLKDISNNVDPSSCATSGDAGVAKTGQKTSYATGDDGDLEKGDAIPRFTDNGNGTVTDNLTGLIWLKNASCFGTANWSTALTDCNTLADGACGLTDGSTAGDWRLPNKKELTSLIDYGNHNPALPTGHPFSSVHSSDYWSSSTRAENTGYAWCANVNTGEVTVTWGSKTNTNYVWSVRNGN